MLLQTHITDQYPYYGPILNSEDSHWDKIFQVNVKGYFEFAKACSTSMIENKSGKIINVASIAAKTPLSGLGVYNISKAAVVMLTKVLAKELASENIQVNTLAPGLIKTDFSRALWEDENVYFLGWHYILHLMHPILLQDRYLLLMAALQPKC